MSKNPYLISGPAVISFSGGRTSGFMLKQIIDAHGGKLPDNVHVVFANTGREISETLDFVRECSERWGVHITWLEYRFVPGPDGEDGAHTYEQVSHNSASRNGEPFEALIKVRSMLPNPVMRFCTQELKVRPMKKFMQSMGYENWLNVVGIRADEPMRVARMRTSADKQPWDNDLPLAKAKVTRADVTRFWAELDFDLRLPNNDGTTPLGNCDLCFMKGAATLTGIMRHADLADWWIKMEAMIPSTKRGDDTNYFRKDRPSYAAMLKITKTQGDMFIGAGDDSLPCHCHD